MPSHSDVRPYDYLKRLGDVFVASLGLVVVSPVLAVTAILVTANLGRPVIFAQDRPGRYGRVFRVYKFRTMRGVDVERGWVTDDQRLPKFGRVLRSTSLDELPTLVNVIKGDMSLVGPRPLLVQYLDRYSPEQARRHEVRPGVTGLAQVSGRNELDWARRFELDVEYVDRRSFILDLRILVRTFTAVVSRRGVSARDHATMSEFFGDPGSGGQS